MTTVASSASHNEGEVARLKRQLQQREFHLAELIDEVVYAERAKDEAIAHSQNALAVSPPVTADGAASLERAFQELLCFDLTVFTDVIVPVLLEVVVEHGGDANSAISTMLRHDAIHNTLEGLLEDRALQQPTKTLIYKVLRQASALRDVTSQSSAPAPVSTSGVQLERAVVLSGLLLRRQHDLMESLAKVREALNGVYRADVSAHDYGGDVLAARTGPLQSNAVQGSTAYVRKLEREREALQLQLLNNNQRSSITEALIEEKRLLEQEVVRLRQQLIEAHTQLSEQRRSVTATTSSSPRSGVDAPHRPVPPAPYADSTPDSRDTVDTDLAKQLAEATAENQSLREALTAARRAPHGTQLVQSPLSPQAIMHTKVAELETLVSSLRGSLQTMESRVETLQSLREREKERIMARHAQEIARIRAERDECAALVQTMASELHALAEESRASEARSSLAR